jgi:hypothetical protein
MQNTKDILGINLFKEYFSYYESRNKYDKKISVLHILIGYLSMVYSSAFGYKQTFKNIENITRYWFKIHEIDKKLDNPNLNFDKVKVLDDFFKENFKNSSKIRYYSAFKLKETAKREIFSKSFDDFFHISIDIGKYSGEFIYDLLAKNGKDNLNKFKKFMISFGISGNLMDNVIDYEEDINSYGFDGKGKIKYLSKCFFTSFKSAGIMFKLVPLQQKFNFLMKHFPLILYAKNKTEKRNHAKSFFNKVKFKY